jgi:methylthioribose-1-phosphate isomerase
MLVSGKPYRTIWRKPDGASMVQIIDQTKLPWSFEIVDLKSSDEVARAISEMWVRGAGLIGATAGYGMWLAALEAAETEDFWRSLNSSAEKLIRTRPTAVNLAWAVRRQLSAMKASDSSQRCIEIARSEADAIADEDVEACRRIGEHGFCLIREIAAKKSGVVNILTHCNAGWLAFVDHGSATAPIYAAHDAGIPVHIWVDETRPRNQGARLTAWELAQHGVPHTVICDNTGGHLMQHGQVDLVITGADRVTRAGDVANKIGTYLKALAARDNGVPFYVALPSSTIDREIRDGVTEIPIEARDGREISHIEGVSENGRAIEARIVPEVSQLLNFAFDVTPARLVTSLITERGICAASEEGMREIGLL